MILAGMMREACDELEADLQDMGIWLGDLWTGRLTVRRAAVLASQLPAGSRVHQASESDAMWTSDDYWSAELADRLSIVAWQVANYGAEKGKTSPVPDRIERPANIREKAQRETKLKAGAKRFQEFTRNYHDKQ